MRGLDIETVRNRARTYRVEGVDSTAEPTTHMQIRPTMSQWRAVTQVDGVTVGIYNCTAI